MPRRKNRVIMTVGRTINVGFGFPGKSDYVNMTVGRTINTCSVSFVCSASSDTVVEGEGTIRTMALTVKTNVPSLSQHREENAIVRITIGFSKEKDRG